MSLATCFVLIAASLLMPCEAIINAEIRLGSAAQAAPLNQLVLGSNNQWRDYGDKYAVANILLEFTDSSLAPLSPAKSLLGSLECTIVADPCKISFRLPKGR